MTQQESSFEAIELTAAQALQTELGERSGEIEAAGEVPGDLVQRMRAAGLFEATVPRRYGGRERHARAQRAADARGGRTGGAAAGRFRALDARGRRTGRARGADAGAV